MAALVIAPLVIDSPVPAVARAAAAVYAAGSLVCHQRPERSFHIDGHQQPVCARCSGLYVSALAGGLLGLVLSAEPMPSARARVWLGLAALPTLFTVILELAGFAHPSNTIRMLSAVPLGAVAAWLVIGIARYEERPRPR